MRLEPGAGVALDQRLGLGDEVVDAAVVGDAHDPDQIGDRVGRRGVGGRAADDREAVVAQLLEHAQVAGLAANRVPALLGQGVGDLGPPQAWREAAPGALGLGVAMGAQPRRVVDRRVAVGRPGERQAAGTVDRSRGRRDVGRNVGQLEVANARGRRAAGRTVAVVAQPDGVEAALVAIAPADRDAAAVDRDVQNFVPSLCVADRHGGAPYPRSISSIL